MFNYIEQVTPINYSIREFNFESSGKHWDSDSITGTFSAQPGTGSGDIKGDFMLNFTSMKYRSTAVIRKFDLNIIDQYLKDLTNYGSFSANLDADMTATGSFENKADVTIKGLIAVNDFHFGKNKNDDYAAFKKFTLAINELSPLKHIYIFDSVTVLRPYFKYEQYDSLDNMETMFGKNGNNITSANSADAKFNLVIEIGNYIKELSKNFFRSDYKINRFAISEGNIRFNDYSISEKFAIGLDPLYIFADSIDKNHKRVSVFLQSGIQPYGQASVAISINPKDSSEFDLQYHLLKLPAPMFNPYLISFTSYPMDKGSIELNGEWNVRNGTIQSKNHLLIIDPRSTKRVKNKDTKWIPTWLILAFIRERGNVIDYEVPITGNLKDPKFHLHDVITDALTNIFVKPATTPYRVEVKEVETEIENSLILKWDMRHNTLQSNQERFIHKMADFVRETPEASIVVSPQQYAMNDPEAELRGLNLNIIFCLALGETRY